MRKIYHLGVYGKNFGDNALNLVVDSFFKDKGEYIVGNLIDSNDWTVAAINKRIGKGDVLIVGGGGLIHEYTEKGESRPSGMIWEISPDDVLNINAKVVLYSVGHNHFFTDKTPSWRMERMFSNILKMGGIISLRNDGSKERLIRYFPQFKDDFITVPDVGVFAYGGKTSSNNDYAILQIACDRLKKRYGNFDDFEKLIEGVLDEIDIPVKLIPHTLQDMEFYNQRNLKEKFPNIEIVPLKNKVSDTDELLNLYANAKYTISTRGHSQIISVGNCTPTFSISTHDKIEGFSKSCGLEEYNFNYMAENSEVCMHKFKKFIGDLGWIHKQLIIVNNQFSKEIKVFNRDILK